MEVALHQRPSTTQQRFVVDDGTQVGEARRAAQRLANFEFNADLAGKVAIVATELANNLLRHAGGGELLLQTLGSGDRATLELLAIDRGPGMQDVDHCLRDGYSTGGTPGTGLGAIRRLSSEFDIYSQPGEGTVVLARFGAAEAHRYGVVSLALEGEVECGDTWCVEQSPDAVVVLVMDGLGHGSFAAAAARAGAEALRADPFAAPRDVLARAHALMSGTRGGAGACARLSTGRLSYAGIGNITGTLVEAQKSQGLVSHNGTLGLGQRRVQQFEYGHGAGAILVMHSDGLSARWDLRHRRELLVHHPAVLAAVLYRDHARGRDDATVVVVPA